MPNYVLYYFNGRGRAEICRLLFEAAGVKYEDKRIEFSEWKDFRDKMPNSMLPVLEIDKKIRIPQSMAISRYLAREFGLHGKTNIEMARIEYICDCFYDIFNDYMKMYHEKDGRLLALMGTDCRIRSSDLTGITITMADLMCYSALESPLHENPTLLQEYPKLQALRTRVAEHAQLSIYFNRRDKTDF
ncbi:S-crystallin 4 [Octopus bimaculoides]|uniref:S-crystallin 4 n=1 Tax=Octopus bimaculoides TaxID=37653 RepID=UPI00071E482C|nr:S-crystallin 4 [Octopus bimaculoides]|eukprot:XP_014771120.1 PREDICTED: S-crystallin 4-like [Octopus bimaculoides]